jgi:hypothetical protein
MTDAPIQPSPADGIRVIKYSLKCFSYSFGGLIPVLGLPLVVLSFSYFLKARAAGKGCWNPAKKYLLWGSVVGSAGLLITLAVIIFTTCAMMKLLPWQYEQQ